MYIILWKYQVKTDCIAKFEELYSANGAWAMLFKKHGGYLGTELFHENSAPDRYLTIDRWISQQAYEEFKRDWKSEYESLDAECEGLTTQEIAFGNFEETTDKIR